MKIKQNANFVSRLLMVSLLFGSLPVSAALQIKQPSGFIFSGDVDAILEGILTCLNAGEQALDNFISTTNNESYSAHVAKMNDIKAALTALLSGCEKGCGRDSGQKAEALKAAGELLKAQREIAQKTVSIVEGGRGSKALALGLKLQKILKDTEKGYGAMQGYVSRMKIALNTTAPDKVGKASAVGSKLTQLKNKDIKLGPALAGLGKRVGSCNVGATPGKSGAQKKPDTDIMALVKASICRAISR